MKKELLIGDEMTIHQFQQFADNNIPAVSSVVKRTLSVREVWGSIPGPAKSTQCRQRLATVATFLRSCVAQALSRGDALLKIFVILLTYF